MGFFSFFILFARPQFQLVVDKQHHTHIQGAVFILCQIYSCSILEHVM